MLEGRSRKIPSAWQHPVLMITSNALALMEMRGIILSRANVIQNFVDVANGKVSTKWDRALEVDDEARLRYVLGVRRGPRSSLYYAALLKASRALTRAGQGQALRLPSSVLTGTARRAHAIACRLRRECPSCLSKENDPQAASDVSRRAFVVPGSASAPALIAALQSSEATSSKEIVAGNEPAVSGGFGSHFITHNDEDAM